MADWECSRIFEKTQLFAPDADLPSVITNLVNFSDAAGGGSGGDRRAAGGPWGRGQVGRDGARKGRRGALSGPVRSGPGAALPAPAPLRPPPPVVDTRRPPAV